MIHAIITFCATPQRTADALLAVPAPMTAPVMVWVVETGIPRVDALKTTMEPDNDALNP